MTGHLVNRRAGFARCCKNICYTWIIVLDKKLADWYSTWVLLILFWLILIAFLALKKEENVQEWHTWKNVFYCVHICGSNLLSKYSIEKLGAILFIYSGDPNTKQTWIWMVYFKVLNKVKFKKPSCPDKSSQI
jgi:hypothetical protein